MSSTGDASASKIHITQIQVTAHQRNKIVHGQVAQSSLRNNGQPHFLCILFAPTSLHQDVLKRQQAKSNVLLFIILISFRIIFLPARTMITTMTPTMITVMARTRSATPRWPWRKGLEWRFTRRRLTGGLGNGLGGAGPTVGIW